MKQIVKYKAIDPYYSDFIETYIGSNAIEVENIRRENEEYIARNHSSIYMIYKPEIIFDDTFNFGTNVEVDNSEIIL